jgi:hypothetical protein
MAKNNHKKLKNTGILFELLMKQLTSDILSDHSSKAKNILQKYFNKDTELSKELILYQSLVEDKFKKYKDAEMLINTISETHRKLNYQKLQKEKYQLIGEIKDNFDIKDFFKSKLNNYTLLASIYKLLESNRISIAPSEIVSSKSFLIEYILKEQKANKKEELKDYKNLSEDLRLLAHKLMVERFNEKYQELDNKQKEILSQYINHISNSTKLKEYVDKQALNAKVILTKLIPKIKEGKLKIKLEYALNEMENKFKGNIANDDMVLNLMRYYQIIKNLKTIII